MTFSGKAGVAFEAVKKVRLEKRKEFQREKNPKGGKNLKVEKVPLNFSNSSFFKVLSNVLQEQASKLREVIYLETSFSSRVH